MAYFGLTFWNMKEKTCLGMTIVEADDIHAALTKAGTLQTFPIKEEGTAGVIASEIPPEKLKYFPIEMFDTFISMEKLQTFMKGSDPLKSEVKFKLAH